MSNPAECNPPEERLPAISGGMGISEIAPEPDFGRMTRLAARMLCAPIALICLVDGDRQTFKSIVGLPEPWESRGEILLSRAFCRLVVAGRRPLVIGDARLHPEVVSNPAIADPRVAAYLGVPLLSRDGEAIGSLGVIDHAPRAWEDEDVAALGDLAGMIVTKIALRRGLTLHWVLGSAVQEANDGFLISEAEPIGMPGPRVVYVNDAFTRMTGYEPGEILGRTLRILDGPKTDRATLDLIRARIAARQPVRAELISYRKDRSEHWVELNIRPVAAADGRTTHFIAIQRDISERKEAEARLRESERKFRAIFDGSFEFIGLLSPDGMLLKANRTALGFLGIDLAEVAGKPFWETPWWSGSAERVARLRSAIAEAARGRFVRFETEHSGADGRVITVDFSLTPVRDESGEVVLLIPEGRDVTERKRDEEAIRSQRQLLKLATRAAGLAIWDWDLASGRTTWSGEFHRLVGLGPGEIGETSDAFEDLLHPDDREDVRRGCAEARDRGGEYRGEHRILLPDGTIRWIAARGGALYDEATGAATRMVGVCMDVTERKDLEQQIRDRAERLAEADRRKDEFLAMLGHELRNPLAPIFHAVKLLELRDDDPELRGEMRALIDRQVRSLARLVDDLLDVSRITRGKIQLRKEAVDLATVVARAVATSEPLIKARAHRLAVELPDRPVRLLADPLRLEQVLVNLVNNAAKYTDPGGSIRVEAAIEGGEVVVRVGDSGVGIAPELLPRIFDPFTQDERAPERSEAGLGIGLTLVRSLVRMHEGSVEARSEGPGRGSEFLVRLPLLGGEPAPVPVAPDGPLAVGTARSWRVLVIDDNVPACRSLALILGEWGHVVRVCHDGAEALATARDFRPEVVLLDIGLPDMDGLTVARRLRDRPEHRNTMLIAMTGFGHDEDRRRSLEAGFDDHLVKPLDLDALEHLLADLDPGRRSSPARLAAPLESGLFSIA